MSLSVFADKMDCTVEQIRGLLHGYTSITVEIADKLEKSLGASSEFWINREFQFRDSTMRLKQFEEEKWLSELPLKDMIKYGWIENAENQIKSCLEYFNVPDVWTWRRKYGEVTALTAFRKSATIKSQPAAISAWLRQGEIQSELHVNKPWNAKLFKETLIKIRTLTKKKSPKDFVPKIIEACAECGVGVAIVKTPSGCTASGATQFLDNGNGLILLSFRYLSDDHFWFTFFHEAGHLLLHSDKSLYIEEEDEFGRLTQEEKEANEFASKMLIPEEFQEGLRIMKINKRELMEFAKKADLPLGIVVGQLQHMGRIGFKNLNAYKRRYSWDELAKFTHPRK
jgi:Zn-dependent peptidase ImmA (M78 family)